MQFAIPLALRETNMPSPYVRHRRLATEIRKIREERGLTVQQCARLVYLTPTKVTRLENAGGQPDIALIMNMIDRLEIGGSRYDRLLRLARTPQRRDGGTATACPWDHVKRFTATSNTAPRPSTTTTRR